MRADPAHLPRLAGGRPLVLVAEGVMDPSPLAAPALDVWIVANRGGVNLLLPLGTRAGSPEAAAELPSPPAGTLAVIASERLRVAPLLRWWAEASGLPAPPFLLAATGQAALPGLLALLAESLATSAGREAEALRAVVAARQEMEETREAMADTVRMLAHRPPAEPRLVLSGEAGDAAPVTGAARHKLGTGLAGLAALAVHIAGPATGPGLLRLRLLAAESDRVVGAWAIPAADLSPGWLTLDLPTPLGPLRETALLEIVPEGDSLPPLSREARWAGAEGEHPLAVRAWAGAPGSRYLAPAHWMPEEVGLSLPRADIPLALPEATWESARAIEGQMDQVALGDEAPRPLLRAPAGGRAILLIPYLHAAGLDRVRVAFAGGAAPGASVCLWVHPVDALPENPAQLDRMAQGSATTGWRSLPEEGLELALPLSAHLSGRASLAVGLRAGPDGVDIELAQVALSAIPMGEALPAPSAVSGIAVPASPTATAAAMPKMPVREAVPAQPAPPTAAAVTAPASAVAPAPIPAAAPVPAAPPAEPVQPPKLPPAPLPIEPAPVMRPALPPAPQPAPVAPPARPISMPVSVPAPLPPAMVPAAGAPAAPEPLRASPARAVPEAASSAPAAPAAPQRVYIPPSLPLPPMPRPIGAAPQTPAPGPGAPAQAAAPTPSTPPRPAVPPVRATPTNVAPGRAPARFEAVRLHQHLPGESYRHLDITIASLASGPMRWASVRVKLASKDGEARLEFRQAAGWPHMFRDWLGRASDKFGPFLRITQPELREFLDSMKDERDAAMMQALFAVLPRVAEDAARQAGLSVADTAQWVESAKALQDESQRTPA
nr:DUF6212 domain-containing protein [Pararoseomonas baculiformis]